MVLEGPGGLGCFAEAVGSRGGALVVAVATFCCNLTTTSPIGVLLVLFPSLGLRGRAVEGLDGLELP